MKAMLVSILHVEWWTWLDSAATQPLASHGNMICIDPFEHSQLGFIFNALYTYLLDIFHAHDGGLEMELCPFQSNPLIYLTFLTFFHPPPMELERYIGLAVFLHLLHFWGFCIFLDHLLRWIISSNLVHTSIMRPPPLGLINFWSCSTFVKQLPAGHAPHLWSSILAFAQKWMIRLRSNSVCELITGFHKPD